MRRKKIYVAALIAAAAVTVLSGCGGSGNTGSGESRPPLLPANNGNTSGTAVSSKTESAKTDQNKTGTDRNTTETAPVAAKYTYSSAYTGRDYTVEDGEAVSYTEVRCEFTSRRNATVLLPDVEVWSGGAMKMTKNYYESGNGWYVVYYVPEPGESLSFWTDAYLAMLEERFGFRLDKSSPWTQVDDYFYSYTGAEQIERGKFYWTDFTSYDDWERYSDLLVKVYHYDDTNAMRINIPSSIDLADVGVYYSSDNAYAGGTTVYDDSGATSFWVMSDYGKNVYDFNNWGGQSQNYVSVFLNPERCREGDCFDCASLMENADLGVGGAIALKIVSQDFKTDSDTHSSVIISKDEKREILDAYVEIVKKNSDVTVLYYMADFMVGNARHMIEGLAAVTAEQEREAIGGYDTAGGNNTDFTADYPAGSQICPQCLGRKVIKCTHCINGKMNCPQNCHAGWVPGMYGEEGDWCTRCDGVGWIRCTYGCDLGDVTCPTCKGKGTL